MFQDWITVLTQSRSLYESISMCSTDLRQKKIEFVLKLEDFLLSDAPEKKFGDAFLHHNISKYYHGWNDSYMCTILTYKIDEI